MAGNETEELIYWNQIHLITLSSSFSAKGKITILHFIKSLSHLCVWFPPEDHTVIYTVAMVIVTIRFGRNVNCGKIMIQFLVLYSYWIIMYMF